MALAVSPSCLPYQTTLLDKPAVAPGDFTPDSLIVISKQLETVKMVSYQRHFLISQDDAVSSHVGNLPEIDDLPNRQIVLHAVIGDTSSHPFRGERGPVQIILFGKLV
jgi:hypothetical protein